MAYTQITMKQSGFGQTMRKGAWWSKSLVILLVLSAFVAYSTWAAFQGVHYRFGNYLSPFYSPEILGDATYSWFGAKPGWLPAWLPFTPALLILWAPGGFRFTCYYYRGAYYKAFWGDPPACAVGEPRQSYWGERSFPLILQNVHRYFLYLALIFLIFLVYDAWKAFWFDDGFGIGVGTIVLSANVFFLGGYTFSCHSLRHLIGGRCDELSKKPLQCAAYNACSSLNKRHMLFAWCSLFVVGFSDIYVRLCSMGVWTDWRIF